MAERQTPCYLIILWIIGQSCGTTAGPFTDATTEQPTTTEQPSETNFWIDHWYVVLLIVLAVVGGVFAVFLAWLRSSTIKRKSVTVQIISVHGSGQFHGSNMAFFQELRKEASKRGVQIYNKDPGTAEQTPLSTGIHVYKLLFCVNVTRVQSDIHAAMELAQQGIECPILLAVFHHTRQDYQEHTMPTKDSIEPSLASAFAHICDVRFFSQHGMYPCAENTKAIMDTAKFLQEDACKTQ